MYAARPLNAQAGDQGLRMRADADAEARTGGGIDFFGGNADGRGIRASTWARRWPGPPGSRCEMLTDGRSYSFGPGSGWTRQPAYGIALAA